MTELARISLALLVLLSIMKTTSKAVLADQMPYSRGVWGQLIRQPRTWMVWLPGLFVLVTLLGCWSLGYWVVPTGLGIVFLAVISRSAVVRSWPSQDIKRLGMYTPASVLLLAVWLTECVRESGLPIPANTEWDVAAGIVGCSWTLCGLRKVQQSGWAWAQAPNISLLLAERLYVGPAFRRRLSRWFLDRPGWLLFVGIGGLGIELLGVSFCMPELRMGYASAVAGFMLFNYLLFGFVEMEWGLMGIVVAMGGTA